MNSKKPPITKMHKKSKIFIAGHNGMVGLAIWRNLEAKGYKNLIGKSSKELDLRRQSKVEIFFENEKPDYVIDAAAKVGGILANNEFRGQFLYENLMIQNNLIHNAYKSGVKKLLFLGSSCIYPRESSQPINEEYLLTGLLEPTNEPYAIAKIAGIKMCESYYQQYGLNFISVMPTNLYGPGDNYDLKSSHVLPALIRKFHEAKIEDAKSVELWGSGKPFREFMHVDDLARAVVHLMDNVDAEEIYKNKISHINIGTGKDLPIRELGEKVKQIVSFQGEIVHDHSKPDGMFRKLLNVGRLKNLGFTSEIDLDTGIKMTYDDFLNNVWPKIQSA
jgi:GDP-L-fucose synthase